MSNIVFNITYSVPGGGLETFEFRPSKSLRPQPLMLRALYENAIGYSISLILDGKPAIPNPPEVSFSTIEALVDWVNDNWYIYGRWFWLAASSTIVFVGDPAIRTGQLVIKSADNILAASIPEMQDGYYYLIVFRRNGQRISPINPDTVTTPGAILQFVSKRYKGYGEWSIDKRENKLVLNGSVPLNGYTLEVILISTKSAFSLGFSLGFNS